MSGFFPLLVSAVVSPTTAVPPCQACAQGPVVPVSASQWQFFSLVIQQSHLINLNQFANVFIYMENPLDKQGFWDTEYTLEQKAPSSLKKKSPDTQAPSPCAVWPHGSCVCSAWCEHNESFRVSLEPAPPASGLQGRDMSSASGLGEPLWRS